jgi:hypothetical protein
MAITFPVYYLGGIEGKIITIGGRPALLPGVGEALNLTERDAKLLFRRWTFPDTEFQPFTRDVRVRNAYMARKDKGFAVAKDGNPYTREELIAMLGQLDDKEEVKKAPASKKETPEEVTVEEVPEEDESEDESSDGAAKTKRRGRPKKEDGE